MSIFTWHLEGSYHLRGSKNIFLKYSVPPTVSWIINHSVFSMEHSDCFDKVRLKWDKNLDYSYEVVALEEKDKKCAQLINYDIQLYWNNKNLPLKSVEYIVPEGTEELSLDLFKYKFADEIKKAYSSHKIIKQELDVAYCYSLSQNLEVSFNVATTLNNGHIGEVSWSYEQNKLKGFHIDLTIGQIGLSLLHEANHLLSSIIFQNEDALPYLDFKSEPIFLEEALASAIAILEPFSHELKSSVNYSFLSYFGELSEDCDSGQILKFLEATKKVYKDDGLDYILSECVASIPMILLLCQKNEVVMNSMQKLLSFYERVVGPTAEKFLSDHTECNGLFNDIQPFDHNII